MPTATDTKPDAEVAYKLNAKNIENIKRWELEADGHLNEADQFRAQAAGLIVKELDSGATQRQVAEAIGKSPSHVAHASTAWRMMQSDDFTVPEGKEKERFNTAYKRAKAPGKPETTAGSGEPQEGSQGAPDPESIPFPAWAKQVRELNRLLAEMIDQATEPQIRQFNKILEKQLKAGVSKEDDFG